MDKYVTTKELAVILGITQRRVNQLTNNEKVFKREINGNYDVVKNVSLYYQRKFTKESLDFDKEKTLHEKVKRELAEMKLKELRMEMHPGEAVERVLSGMLVTFRNRILSIPSKLAPMLVGKKDISTVSDTIKQELLDTLTELSEYDPAMFVEGEDIDSEEDNTTIQKDIEDGGSTAINNGK